MSAMVSQIEQPEAYVSDFGPSAGTPLGDELVRTWPVQAMGRALATPAHFNDVVFRDRLVRLARYEITAEEAAAPYTGKARSNGQRARGNVVIAHMLEVAASGWRDVMSYGFGVDAPDSKSERARLARIVAQNDLLNVANTVPGGGRHMDDLNRRPSDPSRSPRSNADYVTVARMVAARGIGRCVHPFCASTDLRGNRGLLCHEHADDGHALIADRMKHYLAQCVHPALFEPHLPRRRASS